MLKLYITSFFLSLIVLLRSAFYSDIAVVYQLISLLILIFSSAMSAIELQAFTAHGSKSQNANLPTSSSDNFDCLLSNNNENRFYSGLLRLGHLLHLANPKASITSKTTYALNCAHEFLNDKIILFHQFKDKQLFFISGIKSNASGCPQRIMPQDPIVEETYSKINNLIDLKTLNRNNFFADHLPFKSKRNETECLLLSVAFFGQIKGILTIICPPGQMLGKTEKNTLKFFAENFSVLIENHEIYLQEQNNLLVEAEHRLTRELFSELLPDSTPSLPDWEVALHSLHSQDYSGDFYHFADLAGKKTLLIIGKASGRGIEAALFFVRLRTIISCFIDEIKSPAELLNKLSTIMNNDFANELFATTLAVQIESGKSQIQVACAGQALPLINHTRNGYVEIPELENGVPLGLFDKSPTPYKNQVIQLLPGDGLFIYTDGITEFGRKDGKRIDTEKIKLTLESFPEMGAAETLENLIGQLLPENHKNTELNEDQTALYLKLE
ncbi:MAG: PP2C family protein-serine/threonine phosphatase [Candidatus Rifleibacteriota bacterium]